MTSCSMRMTRRPWSFTLLRLLLVLLACQAVRAQAPQWVEKPVSQEAALGSTVQFVCRSSGPDTGIVWSKGFDVIFLSGQRFTTTVPGRYTLPNPYTLQIADVQRSDNDMYGCNLPDLGSATANLTVLLPPGPPSITSDLTGDVFQEGQVVRFTCSSQGGNPPPSIAWMKNGVELLNVALGQTSTEGGVTRNVLSVSIDHSDHQANYTCFVYNRVNQNNPLIASKILNVQYSPIITFEPFSPYTVRQGRPANITCQVDANPPVNRVTWQKDGRTFTERSDFVWMFPSISRDDSGNYTCLASNTLSNNSPTQNSIRVNVVYPPEVRVPAEQSVRERSSVSVTCSVEANPYPYQIVWEQVFPDGSRRQKSNSEELSFAQIRREDAGNYACKASSLLKVSGVSTPETVFGENITVIHVQYPPGPATIDPVDNVDVGQTLRLTCSATPEGHPTASFRWRRNGAEQREQGAVLTVPQATLADSALYTCTPFNMAGEGAPANISISINEPPRLLQRLQEEITRTISNTQPLNFTCRGQGRPQPVIEWFKDNGTDSLSSLPNFYFVQRSSRRKDVYSYEVESTLLFKGSGREIAPSGERVQLRIEDLGSYTCRVTSPVHTVAPTSTAQLFVQFVPILTVPSRKIAVTATNSAELPCRAQSYPPPAFHWYRNGQLVDLASSQFSEQQSVVTELPSAYQSSLTISRVGSGDYGLYHCVVSNFLANATATVNITTKSAPEAPTSLQTLGRTWDSIHLQWTPGFNGGFPQQFKVSVQELGTPDPVETPDTPFSPTQYNVTGLKPSTRYKLAVIGMNKLGIGQQSLSITSQTWDLEIPTLNDAVPEFHVSSKQLVFKSQPSAEYCLKIEVKDSAGAWRAIKQCTRVLGSGSLEIVEEGIVAVNISVCLVDRPDVCGPPTQALISQPESKTTLTVQDVIIIACVCAFIIIVLLIVLVCFICRRRAQAKHYTDSAGIPPSASNGGIPSKKMQQGAGQPQMYDNADGRYPTFASTSEYPPNYWDSNSPPYDPNNLSFDSQLDRQMYELELNRRNDLALYGRAEGYRGQQESIGMQGRPMSPSKDKYLDLEDPNDPSLQSQESGYSTGDPNKPKKTHKDPTTTTSTTATTSSGPRFAWRPPRPFSTRRRLLSRLRKKQKSRPHPRFSHSPPGHTCGLPCCSEDVHIHLRLGGPRGGSYGCMPAPYRADLENNFTFRRSHMLAGRPSWTNKFYSLQTKNKTRAGLPKFHDDFAIKEEEEEDGDGGTEERSPDRSSPEEARETLRRYRAALETDTDSDPQPYLDGGTLDASRCVIRTPIRFLQPWECFHNREIILPDLPGTPRRMVFLDYRPGESHDGAETEEEGEGEEEERIEVYTSGYHPPPPSTPRRVPPSLARSPSSHSSSSSSPSSPASASSTSSSSSSPTQTTTTTSTASPKFKAGSGSKVIYSGAVRPIPAPTVLAPLKSALKKKPATGDLGDSSQGRAEEGRCPVCRQNRASLPEGQGEDGRDQGQDGQGEVFSSEPGADQQKEAEEPQQDDDPEDLYDGHVYDVLSDVAPRLQDDGKPTPKDSNPRHPYTKVSDKPPPVPPTRRNDKPQPEPGRKAITPEMKRRRPAPERPLAARRGREKSEERYSTFPTRRRHHHYEEVKVPGIEKESTEHPAGTISNLLDMTNRLDILSLSDKAKLVEDSEEVDDSLYEALNPAVLCPDLWSVEKNLLGGSVSSLDSARLSHASYSSYGCTCLSAGVSPQGALVGDVPESDVKAACDVGDDVEEEKRGGFLADNPITLIL